MISLFRQRVDRERADFKAAIDPDQVCALASAYNDQRPCQVFAEAKSGSYNVCFFVEFEPRIVHCEPISEEKRDTVADVGADSTESSTVTPLPPPAPLPERWVVRFPLPSVHDAREKLASEVATMKYVSAFTDIPIPRVHACILSHDEVNDGVVNPTRLPCVLMDFVQGVPWHGKDLRTLEKAKSERFYRQLVHIMGQLYLQQFPAIGSLFMEDEAALTRPKDDAVPGKEAWRLGRPLSMDLNDQASEGLEPERVLQDRTYSSTADYTFTLYHQMYHGFKMQRDSVNDEADAKHQIFAFENFRDILFGWIDPKLNYGPFVLMHGDLRPSNIVVDADFNIISIIDWEWSRVVPAQYFIPPTWITGYDADVIAGVGYSAGLALELFKLWDNVRPLKRIDVGVGALFEHWDRSRHSVDDAAYLIPSALLRFAFFDCIYFDGLHHSFHCIGSGNTIDNFFTPWKRKKLLKLVAQKVEDLRLYRAELKGAGLDIADEEGPPPDIPAGQAIEARKAPAPTPSTGDQTRLVPGKEVDKATSCERFSLALPTIDQAGHESETEAKIPDEARKSLPPASTNGHRNRMVQESDGKAIGSVRKADGSAGYRVKSNGVSSGGSEKDRVGVEKAMAVGQVSKQNGGHGRLGRVWRLVPRLHRAFA